MHEMIRQVIGSLPSSYTRKDQKGWSGRQHHHQEKENHPNLLASGDIVELSAFAPKAFTTEELAGVFAFSDRLVLGGEVSLEEIRGLQADRILVAVLALGIMSIDSSAINTSWPGELEPCSADEFESAYQRLVQHVRKDSIKVAPELAARTEARRRRLVEAYRAANFEALTQIFA